MRYFLLLLFLTLMFSPVVFAQGGSFNYFRTDDSYLADPYYESMCRKLLKQSDRADFSYDSFRRTYMRSSHYQPIPDEIKEQMMNYAYQVKQTNDAEKVAQIVESYRALVDLQLANMDVMMMAITLSKEDNRLGSPEFFREIAQGLLKSVLKSGDGRTEEHAYDILTTGEEILLLDRLDVNVLKTEHVKGGYFYFNMHEVQNRQNGEIYTLFVNVSYPVMKTESMRSPTKRSIEVPKQ